MRNKGPKATSVSFWNRRRSGICPPQPRGQTCTRTPVSQISLGIAAVSVSVPPAELRAPSDVSTGPSEGTQLAAIESEFPGRLRRETYIETVITNASRIALIGMGFVAFVFVLYFGQILLAPIFLAIVVGLMVGPIADRFENLGLPSGLSAAITVLLFIVLIAVVLTALAMPLSAWVDELPRIWQRLQSEVAKWQGVLVAMENIGESIRNLGVAREENMIVTVDEGSTVETAAFLAPAIGAQILLFLATMYFFIATRREIRTMVLSICFTRRMRWRMAHVFRDVELRVSRFLLSITAVNIGLGALVGLSLWVVGTPSPLLWALLAGLLNYIAYLGPALMAVILLGVGLATGDTMTAILTPVGIYLVLNFISDQFVSPHIVGRSMDLNPFFVFLALGFWIFLWGPIGGFVAVPALLIASTMVEHLLTRPTASIAAEQRRVRRHKALRSRSAVTAYTQPKPAA